MYTPLDIENKKFSKQMMNGYSVEEVDDFLDELTVDYEKIYKQSNESNAKIESLVQELERYKNIESTLQNTLVMAQSTADEIKKVAKQEADQLIREAQGKAKEATMEIEKDIAVKTKELDDLQKQFDVYKAKMESLLISQLELLKDSNKE
jgi:cell division initiation protein